MEITSRFKERENSSPLNSPNSHGSSNTSCCSSSENYNNNGIRIQNQNQNQNQNPTPLPITRSDPSSPYPTTFVTADTSSFKQVVQMLTGSTEPPPSTPPQAAKNFVIPPVRTAAKKQGFKLYERRSNALKSLISPLSANFSGAGNHQNASFSPRNKPEILSPSLLDFPSLTLLSPVTPLLEDPFDKSSPSMGGGRNSSASSTEEERAAIAGKGFYFHSSPISTPRDSEPQLLPLFPLSSPRVSHP